MYTTYSPAHPSRSPQPVPAGSALPVSADRNLWHEWLSNTCVLPAQFFNPRVRLYTLCPEAALMHAVLEDALTCFQKQFETEGRRVRRIAHEAEEWFLSDDSHWPFSFISVCAVLGFRMRVQLRAANPPVPRQPGAFRRDLSFQELRA